MIARVLPVLLLLAAAPAMGSPAASAPETDPFLAALAGKSGPDAVTAPSFDPDVEAASWTTRPRREIVDALAARLLRGEAKGWYEPAKEAPALPAPPSRIPADFEAGTFEVADRLAAFVPADAAAVFFESLDAANENFRQADSLAGLLPFAGDPPCGRRSALDRALGSLLLPTIWASNPGVRTGTRQVALVVSDPDLRWAPDIAFVAEVDDASLVRFHRASTLSFENRGLRRLRVDGLDATTDDGATRSFFAIEGGIAVWATTRSLRARVLAAASRAAPSLLTPPARDYAAARTAFPARVAGPLVVVPDAFLGRICSAALRSRRAAALRCEAVRLVLDGVHLSGKKDAVPVPGGCRCPAGGVLTPATRSTGSTCSLHGTTDVPVPLGDVPDGIPCAADAASFGALRGDEFLAGTLPPAMWWGRGEIQMVVPGGDGCPRVLDAVSAMLKAEEETEGDLEAVTRRMRSLGKDLSDACDAYRRITGLHPTDHGGVLRSDGNGGYSGALHRRSTTVTVLVQLPEERTAGGVLRVTMGGGSIQGISGAQRTTITNRWKLEWR